MSFGASKKTILTETKDYVNIKAFYFSDLVLDSQNNIYLNIPY